MGAWKKKWIFFSSSIVLFLVGEGGRSRILKAVSFSLFVCKYCEMLSPVSECLVVSSREPVCLPANLQAAAGSGWQREACPRCSTLRARRRSRSEVDNEQGDKVELWRSYHPEPPGHTALLVVTGAFIIRKTHSLTQPAGMSLPMKRVSQPFLQQARNEGVSLVLILARPSIV